MVKAKKLQPVRDDLFDNSSVGHMKDTISQEIAQNYLAKNSNPAATAASIQKFQINYDSKSNDARVSGKSHNSKIASTAAASNYFSSQGVHESSVRLAMHPGMNPIKQNTDRIRINLGGSAIGHKTSHLVN